VAGTHSINEEGRVPHVVVKLIAGRPEAVKRQLADQIVQAVTASLHCDAESVSVALEEVASGEWMDAVYARDIVPNWETLYREPGYGPRAER
jgi:4-oxalocrotonate tautomerase